MSDSVSSPERRRYFRIDDRVGLSLEPVEADAEAEALAGFGQAARRFGLINELRAIRDAHLPERRQVQNKYPTVANYLAALESQIECLVLAVDSRETESLPEQPDTPVSLSAQGISLKASAPLATGTLVRVRMVLFPDQSRILAMARVVETSDEQRTALEFCEIRDADREAVIRHVHALQMSRLQTDPKVGAGVGD